MPVAKKRSIVVDTVDKPADCPPPPAITKPKPDSCPPPAKILKIESAATMSWLEYFKLHDENRNFAVSVEGTKVFVNQFMLAASSPMFQKMLSGSFKESQQSPIILSGKKLADIVDLFASAMFCPDKPRLEVTIENFVPLHSLAGEYLMEEFLRHCESFLDGLFLLKVKKVSIKDWFEKGIVEKIFSTDRLSKFRPNVLHFLKYTDIQEWKQFAKGNVPTEYLVEVLIDKEERSSQHCHTKLNHALSFGSRNIDHEATYCKICGAKSVSKCYGCKDHICAYCYVKYEGN